MNDGMGTFSNNYTYFSRTVYFIFTEWGVTTIRFAREGTSNE